jgi:hypothetical protein
MISTNEEIATEKEPPPRAYKTEYIGSFDMISSIAVLHELSKRFFFTATTASFIVSAISVR